MAVSTPILKIKKLHEDAIIPEAKTEGSCGLDLTSISNINLFSTKISATAYIVHTGIAVELPKGYHAEIYLRSSTGMNTKLRLANGTGIIDNDYRGEIMLLVENIGKYEARVRKGDRIAQLILVKDIPCKIEVVDTLSATARGEGGIGSTN